METLWKGWKIALIAFIIPLTFLGWCFWEFIFWLISHIHWG